MTRKTVKLSTLKLSPLNVRKSEPSGIEAMAADIAAHGIIQNLVVYKEGRNHMVIAGGRRFRGLKLLQKQKKIDSKYDVPVDVRQKSDAIDISLSENDQREDMHPADLLGAYRALVENDMGVSDIAARHGKSEGYVRRILKLAGLHEDILAAFAADQIGMDAAQAYCLTDDIEKQKTVFEVAGGQAHYARRILTDEKLTTKDRLFNLVSVERYKEAGGTITADLFDGDGQGYANEPQILYSLVDDELKRLQTELIEEGWKEAEAVYSQPDNFWSMRFMDPEGRKNPTKKQQTRLDKNKAKQKALLDDESEDHAYSDEMYKLEREESVIEQLLAFFTDEQKAHGKMIVYLDHSGETVFKAVNLAKAKGDSVEKPPKPDYSSKLAEDLIRLKTLAVQEAVASDGDLAIDLMIYSLFQQIEHRKSSTTTPLAIVADGKAVEVNESVLNGSDIKTIEQIAGDRFEMLKGKVGLANIQKLDPETKSKLLAALVASQIDAQTASWGGDSIGLDDIAREATIDMAEKWTPKASFFERLTKPVMLKILTEYCGESVAENCKKLKKSDLAAEMVSRLEGKGYLPPALDIKHPKEKLKKAA